MNQLDAVATKLEEAAAMLRAVKNDRPSWAPDLPIIEVGADEDGPYVDVEQLDGAFERARPPMTVRGHEVAAPRFEKDDRVQSAKYSELTGEVLGHTKTTPYTYSVRWKSGVIETAAEDELKPAPIAPVEPQAGQVWTTSAVIYVLRHQPNGFWQTPRIDGDGLWDCGCETAARAVRGLTFAAPSVAEFYQRELKARVAELEKRLGDDGALSCLRFVLDLPEQPFNPTPAQMYLIQSMRALIDPALATAREEVAEWAVASIRRHVMAACPDDILKAIAPIHDACEGVKRATIDHWEGKVATAREDGAKAVREERFVVLQYVGGETYSWRIWDRLLCDWRTKGAAEIPARAEAARLNAEHAKEKP